MFSANPGKIKRPGVFVALLAVVVAVRAIQGSAVAATDPTDLNAFGSAINQPIADPAPPPVRPAVAATGASAATGNPLPTGNPLWAVPLKSLSVTRERPIFSPSRRPPAPVVVSAPRIEPVRLPVKPPEPERPPLALVGTVLGDDASIGIFFDQNAKTVVRLRMGDGFAGWILRSVQQREVTLEKNSQTVILVLPAPGSAPAAGGAPPRPMRTPDEREL